MEFESSLNGFGLLAMGLFLRLILLYIDTANIEILMVEYFDLVSLQAVPKRFPKDQNDGKITPWLLVRKRTRRPSNGRFCELKIVASSAQRVPTAVNLDFLDRSRYYHFK
jgi:hypothetical protein